MKDINTKNNKARNKNCKVERSNSKQFKGNRREQLSDEREVVKGHNDPTWNILPDVPASDVANITFNQNPALPYSLGNEYNPTFYQPIFGSNWSTITPGMMAINFTPTYGRSVSTTSALNISAQEFYAALRSKNSGARNYERADLFMYVAAMDSASMLYAIGLRAYAACRTASNKNWYWPRSVVTALGFSYDDLTANASKLRYSINLFAKKMSQFTMPWNFDVYKRHAMLCGSVFTDRDNPKGQLYFFKPDGFYRFNPTKYQTGGCLEWVDLLKQELTVSEYTALLDSVADNLTKIEDIGIMSGDIQKAFPDVPQLQWQQLDENVELAVQNADHAMLAQIHNAVAVGTVSTLAQAAVNNLPADGTPDIYQQGGFLYSDPRFNYKEKMDAPKAMVEGTLVDAVEDWDRTNEGVLYITKLAVTGKTKSITGTNSAGQQETAYPLQLDDFSTEVVNYFSIYGINESTGAAKKGLDHFNFKTYDYYEITNNPTTPRLEVCRLISTVAALSAFDWAPRWVVTDSAGDATNMYNFPMVWETCDPVVVKNDVLSRMHEYTAMAALLRRS